MGAKNPQLAGRIIIPTEVGNGVNNGGEFGNDLKGIAVVQSPYGEIGWGAAFDIVSTDDLILSGQIEAGDPFVSYSGPGAVAPTDPYVSISTTGADAFTLADGEALGNKIVIYMAADGGDGTLTPSNLLGGTTITFNDVGDSAELLWNGSDWVMIGGSATLA